MSTMLQQQQCMTFPSYGSGTQRTPLQQNADTRIHAQRSGCDSYSKISSTSSSTNHIFRDAFDSCNMVLPTAMTSRDATSVLPQHSGKKQPSSQDVQDSDSPNADSQSTGFTLDPPTVHLLPADINETTDIDQQGDELVPEEQYDVFRQAVWSSLGRFHSSGDSAADFQEEIGSLIPTDEVLKVQDNVGHADFAQGFIRLLCQDNAGSCDIR